MGTATAKTNDMITDHILADCSEHPGILGPKGGGGDNLLSCYLKYPSPISKSEIQNLGNAGPLLWCARARACVCVCVQGNEL